jgi:hypothetical protein
VRRDDEDLRSGDAPIINVTRSGDGIVLLYPLMSG